MLLNQSSHFKLGLYFIRQRKDGRYEARALVKGIEINLYYG